LAKDQLLGSLTRPAKGETMAGCYSPVDESLAKTDAKVKNKRTKKGRSAYGGQSSKF